MIRRCRSCFLANVLRILKDIFRATRNTVFLDDLLDLIPDAPDQPLDPVLKVIPLGEQEFGRVEFVIPGDVIWSNCQLALRRTRPSNVRTPGPVLPSRRNADPGS